MVNTICVLNAIAPAAAFSLSSIWEAVGSSFSLSAEPAIPHGAADELYAKYGSEIPGFNAASRESIMQVINEVPEGRDLLDTAFAQLVAKTKPKRAHSPSLGAQSSSDEFATFSSHELPEHRLRYRSPESLNIDDTKQYAGYLDYGSDFQDHLFYWFFESRNNPAEDPVVLWLNGGPGCSSLTGLFFELGPSSIGDNLKPVFNEFSWNNNASVIFIDQPLNVGLSYSEDGTEPVNSVAAERDVYALLELFFQNFPKYAGLPFHIAGESYAGHYIPALGSEIWSHKDRSFKLSSLLIGNGLTHPEVQYTAYADMACGRGGYPSVLEPSVCETMEQDTPRCVNLIKKCYADQSDWACLPATVYCNNKMFGPYLDSGYNFYDVRQNCGNNPCYADEENGARFLNQDYVQKALGTSKIDYQSCNNRINSEFVNNGDWMRPYNLNITELLDDGVRVLVYAGDADYAVNWLGNERWTRVVDWKHSAKFQDEDLQPWLLDGKEVGQVRSYGPLTFARVYSGGHMLPHDQPESSLDLFNRWIYEQSFTEE